MASFPSSWVIKTQEPPKTGRVHRRRSPSPVPPLNIPPSPLPYDSTPRFLYEQCVPGTSDDMFPSMGLDQHPTSRVIPDQVHHAASAEWLARDTGYLSADDRYPSQFPSHWLLGKTHDIDTIKSPDYDLSVRVGRQRAIISSTPALVPSSAYMSKVPSSFKHKLPVRQFSCDQFQLGSSGLRTAVLHELDDTHMQDDLLAGLKGEPINSIGRPTHMGVQSFGQRIANYTHGDSPGSVDYRLCHAGEMHPSSFDEGIYADESGLGDLPHVVHDVPDTYSVSSSSISRGYANGFDTICNLPQPIR